jgi:homoserine kinase
MALEGIGDRVEAVFVDEPGLWIDDIFGDGGQIPRDADKNTAGIAVRALLNQIGSNCGVQLVIHKGLPLASGLGGSAASAVAAVVATNALLGSPLSHAQLLPACIEGEALISGYHADNIAPCLLGGITLITGIHIEQIRQLPVPPDLYFALVTPDVKVPTKEARAVLPKQVTLAQVVSQTAAVARLIDALHRGDVQEAAEAMGGDCIIEPARTHLIPMFKEVCNAATGAGAISTVISGAGPTLCAFCDSAEVAHRVRDEMRAIFVAASVGCSSLVTTVDKRGAYALSITAQSG